jgi:hypothetical protein
MNDLKASRVFSLEIKKTCETCGLVFGLNERSDSYYKTGLLYYCSGDCRRNETDPKVHESNRAFCLVRM